MDTGPEQRRISTEPTETDCLLGGERGGARTNNFFGRLWDTRGDSQDSLTRRWWSHSAVDNGSSFTDITSSSNPMLRALSPEFLTPGDAEQEKSSISAKPLSGEVKHVLKTMLGIPDNRTKHMSRPILGPILLIITLAAAGLFAIPGLWYMVCDIKSDFTKTTVLIGTVQIMLGFAWVCMGVYSNNLGHRLVQNHNFMQCVRVHSKTFLKVSTFWLTFFLGNGVVFVNCYEAWPVNNSSCSQAQVDISVCQAFFVGRVAYDLMFLTWNFIVTYVLYSVCRTQTIGLRQLMRELSLDAKIYEDLCLNQFNIPRQIKLDTHSLEGSWYVWDEHLENTKTKAETVMKTHGAFLQSFTASSGTVMRSQQLQNPRYNHRNSVTARMEEGQEEGESDGDSVGGDAGGKEEAEEQRRRVGSAGPSGARHHASMSSIEEEPVFQPDQEDTASQTSRESDGGISTEAGSRTLLSNEDLLFTYWKFIRRLSVTSRYLQRWLASWVVFIFMWDGYFIIYWTTHRATLADIAQFTIPLIILLLVSSAYAEVSGEGQKVLKTICPTEQRLPVIYYINQYPLSIGVFGIPVTYNAMVTAVLAFSVAFASKMILDEING